jgi:hypothetical protein
MERFLVTQMTVERKEQIGNQTFQHWNLIIRFVDANSKEEALGKFIIETSNEKRIEKLTPNVNNVKDIDVLSC